MTKKLDAVEIYQFQEIAGKFAQLVMSIKKKRLKNNFRSVILRESKNNSQIKKVQISAAAG